MEKTNVFNAFEHLDTILKNIKALIKDKNDFVAFMVLVVGIEFLGSIIDTEDFESYGRSEIRFKIGLSRFLGKKGHWYKNNKEDLYQNLRCPLIHQYRPGNKFYLTSITSSKVPKGKHLREKDGKKILVLECFLEEFEKAVAHLKKNIHTIKQTKRKVDYLIVKSIPVTETISGITNIDDITIVCNEPALSKNILQLSGSPSFDN